MHTLPESLLSAPQQQLQQQFCLRWHNHSSSLVAVFDSLLSSESLVDVTLFAEGQLLRAHKVVLSACSPYFETLFSQTSDKHPIVILKDVQHSHLKALLDFMYRGQVNVSQNELGPIIKTAESLKITGLKDCCRNQQSDTTTPASAPPPPPQSVLKPASVSDSKGPTPPLALPVINKAPPSRPPPNIPISSPHHEATTTSSIPSVLSSALTMPLSNTIANPLSLHSLSNLPPSLASTLANSFASLNPSHLSSTPFPPSSSSGESSPLAKRRRRHRRQSGEPDSGGDSDCRSSSSPGDSTSTPPNFSLPRIPATITPVGSNAIQQHHSSQPKDLSYHSSHSHSASHNHTNTHSPNNQSTPQPSQQQAPHPSWPPRNCKEEPQDLKTPPSADRPPAKFPCSGESADRSLSPERPPNVPVYAGRPHPSPHLRTSSDLEAASPAKEGGPSSQHAEDNSSDNNHFSEDEDSSSGPKEDRSSENIAENLPGPSSGRQTDENFASQNYMWPYVNDTKNEDLPTNLTENSNPDYLHAINLVRAGFSNLLPPRMSSELLSRPAPIGIPLLLKSGNMAEKMSNSASNKSILGYPFPESPRQFACEKCGRTYASTGNLKRHKKYECGVEPQFSCPICQKKFQHRHSVKIHVFSTHRNEAGEGGGQGEAKDLMFPTTDGMGGTLKEDFFQIPQEASAPGGSHQDV